jgi:hypothetical protein
MCANPCTLEDSYGLLQWRRAFAFYLISADQYKQNGILRGALSFNTGMRTGLIKQNEKSQELKGRS